MYPAQRRKYWSLPLALLVSYLSGCSQPQLAAVEVLNYANCQGAERGVRQVSYAEVANLRGSKLLGMTTEAASDAPEVILLSVYKGAQPTPGFSFSLSAADVVQGTAELTVQWHEPEPDTVIITLDPDELIEVAHARLTRGFKPQECATYGIDPCSTLEEIRSGSA